MLKNIICPVCGEFLIQEEYEMCQLCGWFLIEADYNDPDYSSGINECSLNEYKRRKEAGELSEFTHFGFDGEKLSDEEFAKTLVPIKIYGKRVLKQVFEEERTP